MFAVNLLRTFVEVENQVRPVVLHDRVADNLLQFILARKFQPVFHMVQDDHGAHGRIQFPVHVRAGAVLNEVIRLGKFAHVMK